MRPLIHLDTARELPHWQDSLIASGVDRALPRVGWHLAAMAKPPGWVRNLTHGSADHACAEGEEVALMDAALEARGASLFAQGSTAMDDYFAALDARWARVVRDSPPASGRGAGTPASAATGTSCGRTVGSSAPVRAGRVTSGGSRRG